MDALKKVLAVAALAIPISFAFPAFAQTEGGTDQGAATQEQPKAEKKTTKKKHKKTKKSTKKHKKMKNVTSTGATSGK